MKYLRRYVAHRVIVMLIDESGIEGIVAAAEVDMIELTSAEAHQQGQDPAPIDGSAVIRAESILWVQVL